MMIYIFVNCSTDLALIQNLGKHIPDVNAKITATVAISSINLVSRTGKRTQTLWLVEMNHH